MLSEWVHVISIVRLPTVHAKGNFAGFTVIMVALFGLLEDLVTRVAQLELDDGVEGHRRENFFHLRVPCLDSLLAALAWVGL